MPNLPYFPFYVDNYLSSPKVLKMTDAQRGIYIHLLALSWKHPGCILPLDRESLQLLCPRSKWKNVEYVVRECFEPHGVGVANMRLLSEHTKSLRISEKARYAVNCREEQRKHRTDDERTIIKRSSCKNKSKNKNHIKEESKDIGEKKKRFSPPTVKEIMEYCAERQNCVDPRKFFDYYESNGWRVGKNPMKSWQAAVRTWERNRGNYGLQTSGSGGAGRGPRSFFARDVEERAAIRKKTRALLGIPDGGAGLDHRADQGKIDGEGRDAISGEAVCLPKVETPKPV